MIKKIIHYFDKLEDRIRGRLSRYPIWYSLLGGAGIVLFWRGVWVTADEFVYYVQSMYPNNEWIKWVDGPISILVSVLILLATGLFVSFFVTDQVIASGLKQEKKMVEKTEEEIAQESTLILKVKKEVEEIEKEVQEIHSKVVSK